MIMNWINIKSIDELPKDKTILVCNNISIEYILFDMNAWRFCYTEAMISENLLKTYVKYFIPTLG